MRQRTLSARRPLLIVFVGIAVLVAVLGLMRVAPWASHRQAAVGHPHGVSRQASAGTSTRALELAAGLKRLPVNTALSGSEARAWADAALAALGAPTNAANVKTMVDWFANEGTPHDLNNPLNLQTAYGGSSISTANGDPVIDHIQAYPQPVDFVEAFPIEMNIGSYDAIVASLKGGVGLEGSAATPEIASELMIYSGNHYDSIPGRK